MELNINECSGYLLEHFNEIYKIIEGSTNIIKFKENNIFKLFKCNYCGKYFCLKKAHKAENHYCSRSCSTSNRNKIVYAKMSDEEKLIKQNKLVQGNKNYFKSLTKKDKNFHMLHNLYGLTKEQFNIMSIEEIKLYIHKNKSEQWSKIPKKDRILQANANRCNISIKEFSIMTKQEQNRLISNVSKKQWINLSKEEKQIKFSPCKDKADEYWKNMDKEEHSNRLCANLCKLSYEDYSILSKDIKKLLCKLAIFSISYMDIFDKDIIKLSSDKIIKDKLINLGFNNINEYFKYKCEELAKIKGFDSYKDYIISKQNQFAISKGFISFNIYLSYLNKQKRDKFYESKLELIDFEEDGKILSLSSIIKLNNIPGVWYKIASNGQVLDVSKTIDLGKELLFSIRAIEKGYKNIDKIDEEIEKEYKNRYGIYKKYRDMVKYEKNNGNNNIIFKLIVIDIQDEVILEAIEAQFAHDNKALFWNYAPGQAKRIKNIV